MCITFVGHDATCFVSHINQPRHCGGSNDHEGVVVYEHRCSHGREAVAVVAVAGRIIILLGVITEVNKLNRSHS